MDPIPFNKTSTFVATQYPLSDSAWLRFLIDHYEAIMENASAMLISSEEVQMYRYRLNEWLRAKNIPTELIPLILIMNDLDSADAFDGVREFLVPDLRQIETLYAQYKTYANELVSV